MKPIHFAFDDSLEKYAKNESNILKSMGDRGHRDRENIGHVTGNAIPADYP